LDIQSLPLSKLKPAQYNPRKDLTPDDPEYIKLKKSILEFDLVEPIIWNKKTGNVVGGHQRLKILKELKKKKTQVVVVDLPQAREAALNVALNKISGEWDYPKLKDLISEIDTGDFDIEITGFDLDELQHLFDYQKDGLTDEDEIPEQVKPKTKSGDLFQLGDHRLLCGDATKKEDVERLMGGHKADMVFTDPPYNVNYGISKNPRHKIRNLVGDNQTTNKWVEFNKSLVEIFKEYNCGDIYVWGASSPDGMRQRLIFYDNGIHWSATIIWKKQQLVLSPAKYQRKYEPCFYGWLNKSSYSGDRTQTEVWEVDRPLNSKEHPTMKPVELCSKGIINSSKTHEVVMDLFGGSGSTMIACEKLNRHCYMMEIDPHYCDVIIQRWENFTGNKVKKLTNAKRKDRTKKTRQAA
jgi:DNA modification methylase